jgi:hypothetical protein
MYEQLEKYWRKSNTDWNLTCVKLFYSKKYGKNKLYYLKEIFVRTMPLLRKGFYARTTEKE